MKLKLMAACALAVLACAAPAAAQPKPTAADAKAFVTNAEAQLDKVNAFANRAQWVRANFITEDTQWLEAKANAEQNELVTRLATEAAKFNGVATDPVTARKLKLLKLYLVSPAPNRPGAAEELAGLVTKLDSTYSSGKFPYKGKPITLNDAEAVMAESRDPAELKAVWEGWHGTAKVMKGDYARFAALSNEGAVGLGFKDTGALWRSNYDMDPDAFAAETDRLWTQVEPFYKNLHCYVRARLNEKYGDAVQPKTGPIRADLLGNMWAQTWGKIYDVVQPKTVSSSYNLDKLLQDNGYDPVKIVKTGEGFYSSLGYAPLPQTFWERSLIVRPKDREVVCHASAWDLDDKNDIRIKMCTKVDGEDFRTVHHELGHNYYQRAYQAQPTLFRNGANDGFHEAIGDFAALSASTPTYLNQIGLLQTVPGADEDIPFLLKMALDKIAFLPFGLMVDRWRWEVFAGEVKPEQYNDAWWALRLKYQGLVPPGPRPADAFDPGAKYHVAGNTPYTRYFLAHIYQFQFHRAACAQAGWKGPLHRCSVYGQKAVGEKFEKMMALGQSQPWPQTLAVFSGETRTDASAVAEYFKPLDAWLKVQNKGQQCGW
ncbi:MAG: M2 family metallopeptidase [Alphaproteobacteria bacterium]|nr:M2 family metallopeptidase [Alphaproteobacteria bacterium]MBU1517289.1 M2 family metallopeptidase [Alphaproteobacteria bacterium]MBU2093175.1 M2 family metallopeptidase [Alphaproteobacteria bacterium]MBU2150444.1 M2 family metallopeptidase [Alphaproteobacteria bacterium]MBU2305885.1 M2 family metallopeptidase [Alphaproteobacteria bacterium]